MPSTARPVSIIIFGRDYQINCPPEEEEALRNSARYLDRQMEQVRSRGSSLGYEKIAVLAALNIAHQLLKLDQQSNSTEHDNQRELKALEGKIDAVLQASRQIEI